MFWITQAAVVTGKDRWQVEGVTAGPGEEGWGICGQGVGK